MKDTQPLASIYTTAHEAGYIAPIIGRKVHRDVASFAGFQLIRSGETISREIAEQAAKLGRLFELTDATRLDASL